MCLRVKNYGGNVPCIFKTNDQSNVHLKLHCLKFVSNTHFHFYGPVEMQENLASIISLGFGSRFSVDGLWFLALLCLSI
jgi:hypothetical protein